MKESTDDSTLQQVLDCDDFSVRFECGISKPSTSYCMDDIPTILHLLCLHFIILQRKAEIDQLVECLNDLWFLKFLKKYPGAGRLLLTCSGHTKLTAAKLEDLFTIHFSEEGSNKRCEEEQIVMMWLEFLRDVEGTCICIPIYIYCTLKDPSLSNVPYMM